MEHINIIILLFTTIVLYIICIAVILSGNVKIVHKLEYIESKVTVALRHRFSSIDEFKSWRNWRVEISNKVKSFNK